MSASRGQLTTVGSESLPVTAGEGHGVAREQAPMDRWVARQFDPADAPPRVDAWLVEFNNPVQRAVLDHAIQLLVRRHPALRVRFPATAGGRAVTCRPARLRDRAGPGGHGDWAAWVADGAREGQEVEDESLATFWWLNDEGTSRLVVVLDELIGGEAFARLLLQELAEVYSELAARREPMARFPQPPAAPARNGADDGVGVRPADEPSARAIDGSLDLPPDCARPSLPSFCGHTVRTAVPPDLVHALRDVATASRVQLTDAWLAGTLAWLHRLTGAEHVRVGCLLPASASRDRLAFGVDGIAARSFQELVREVSQNREALEDENLAAPAPVAAGATARRDPARPWTYDVTVDVSETIPELQFADVVAVVRALPRLHLDGDLAVAIRTDDRRAEIELRGNRDVFAPGTLHRWLRHLITLLESCDHVGDGAVSRLALLTASEQDRIVREWNPVPGPSLREPEPLHRQLAHVASRRPQHAAVVADGKTLTFSDLEARANRLAHHLRAQGIRPGDRVGLLLGRSAEYAVATLATLKAGAAFVPLDPEWPEERRAFVLRDGGAAVLLSNGGEAGELPDGVRRYDLRMLEPTLAAGPATAPDVAVLARDLAYIIYTSGSTGQPKGVMVEHRALSMHLSSIAGVYRLGPDDRGLLFHSVAFDPAIEQLFSPLVVGGTVYVRGEELWTGREFSEFVRREKITAVTLPPRYWLQLMRDWEREPALAPVGQLRRVLVGGEPLPPTVVDLWRRLRLTSIRLLNGYGPTECTVTATVYEVPAEPTSHEACGRFPVGRPHGPVEAYVLDAELQPQPIGVAGELCLAGPTLARGYLGRDILTRERFVPHPFREGEVLYRTGDRARFLADGTIDFCGRADRQVKVGGYRVEPGEIEAVVGRLDGVQACAVVAEPGPRGESLLRAYVAAADVDAPRDAWQREMRRVLPAYMVPEDIVVVPSLPRTINGKLDTAALTRLGAAARAAAEARARSDRRDGRESRAGTPRDERDAAIAAVWSSLLGTRDVAAEDDFFDAGGGSLLAIELFARLEREFKTRLVIRDWIEKPTFGNLVRCVRGEKVDPGNPAPEAGATPVAGKFLFPIRRAGSRPCLFLFAGGRGCDEDFVVLAALTRELGDDQPVWGVRVGGPDRLEPEHADAWELAEDVATEIRQHQPEGPYHFAGECIGGLLAFEVARVLEREGATVSFLGLINTGCPRPGESLRWWLRTTWLARARRRAKPLWNELRASPWRDAPRQLATAWKQVRHAPRSQRPRRADGMPDDPKDYHYGRMLLRYRPTPARLGVVLFACDTHPREENLRRWSGYGLRGVQMVPVPGDTSSCLREHAADTANRLRTVLDGGAPV